MAGSVVSVTAKAKRPKKGSTGGYGVQGTPPGSKPVPSAKPQAYDPTAPSYKTPADFEDAVQSGAQAQIQPALDESDWERQQAQAASATRQQELQGWYGWGHDKLSSAFQNVTDAANKLISAQSGGTQAEQDSLAAALRGTSGDQAALATQLGGAPPPSQDAQILSAALAQGGAANQGLAGTVGALTAGTGERVQSAAIGGLEASRGEQGRLQALLDANTSQRRGIMARLPDLITQERATLGQQEFGKAEANRQYALAVKQFGESHANRLFQQWLASEQLGLSKKTESFQEWLAQQNLALDTTKEAHQEQYDWANLAVNKEQVEGQLAQLKKDAATAKGKDAKEKAQLRAQQWQNGLSLLSDFLAPASGEGAPHQKIVYEQVDVGHLGADGSTITQADVGAPVRDPNGKPVNKATATYSPRSYGRALQILMSQAGMTRSDALRLLRSSDDVDWRRKAAADLIRLKRRKNAKANLGHAGPDPAGRFKGGEGT